MEELKGGKKNICIGLLAHVDAGKTTLSEECFTGPVCLSRPDG